MDLMLDDYYDSRGWTLEGVPKKEKLEQLGMSDLQGLVEGKEA